MSDPTAEELAAWLRDMAASNLKLSQGYDDAEPGSQHHFGTRAAKFSAAAALIADQSAALRRLEADRDGLLVALADATGREDEHEAMDALRLAIVGRKDEVIAARKRLAPHTPGETT